MINEQDALTIKTMRSLLGAECVNPDCEGVIVPEYWLCETCGGLKYYKIPGCPEGSKQIILCEDCNMEGLVFQELRCDGDCDTGGENYFPDLNLSKPYPLSFLEEDSDMEIHVEQFKHPPVWCTKPEYFENLEKEKAPA